MNICVFSGNIGRDAETKHTPGGKSITRFPLAVTSGYGDKQSTFWVTCSLWEREKVAVYLTKGSKVTVAGELNNRAWTDKDGNERLSLELTIRGDFDLPPKPTSSGYPVPDDNQIPF